MLYSLNHYPTCRFEVRQALIYQLVSGLTDENGKYNYAKAVHHYPPFFDISCSAKNYKIASALTIDEINRYASGTGWDLRGMVLWVHEMNYIYQDEYQIALGPEFIDPDGFAPFSHASGLMNFESEQAEKVITPPNKGRDRSHHWDGHGTFI